MAADRPARTPPAPGQPAAPAEPEALAERVARLQDEHARVLEGLAAGQHRFRLLAQSVWRVQEVERGRFARELHDGLGQTLTALRVRLDVLRLRLADRDPETAREVAEIAEIAGSALAETRELARLLRPPVLDQLGLEAALRWLARRFGERGLEVDAALSGLEAGLPEGLDMLVFRTAQEALNNVAKHSGAVRARLAVAVDARGARLSVEDAGRGFEVERTGPGFGLQSMRDRAEAFGGRFAIRSAPGQGTRVEVELPFAAAAGEVR
jgi:two-component system sensor histidine kinase UhpB